MAGLNALATIAVADAPREVQRFPIAEHGDPIMVPLDIAGGRYPFVFDTGSAVTSFDLSLQPLLRGRAGTFRAHMQNVTQDVDTYIAPLLSIGGMPLETVREVLCLDFASCRQTSGEVICGVLGMDAIKKMIVQIDFDRHELSLLPLLPNDPGEEFELSYVLGVPSVRVELGGERDMRGARHALFWIDTGAFGLGTADLQPALFESLLKQNALRVVSTGRRETVLGSSDASIARLAQLRLGRYKHEALIVSQGLVNALSLGYLSRYRVTFDFPSERMYLSPGARYNETDLYNLAGMRWRRIGGDVVIESLENGGAAEKAGLCEGDLILEIGGIATRSLTMVELSRIFGTPSTRSVTARRPGVGTLRVTIELNRAAADEPLIKRSGDPSDDAAESEIVRGQDIATFKIAKNGNPIVLPVDIGSERRCFLFDTGASITTFGKSLAPLLCGPAGSRLIRSQSRPDGENTELFVAPAMRLGARKLTGIAEVACADQDALRSALGERFDGVLGMDAIFRLIVQIDFDRGELSILPSVPEDAGEPVRLALCLGQRAVHLGWLGDDPGYFMIDTGYVSLGSGSLNSRRLRALLDARRSSLVRDGTANDVVRPTRSREAKLSSFALGDAAHNDLIFSEDPLNALSLNYLSRYRVIIDFARGRMYLKRGARFDVRDAYDLSGLQLSKLDGDVVVEFVRAGSAAELVALRKGDVITEIDGVGAGTFALLDLRRMLSVPSTRLMTIRRGAASWQVCLKLGHDPS